MLTKLAIDQDEEYSNLEQQIIEEIKAGNNPRFLKQVKQMEEARKALEYNEAVKTAHDNPEKLNNHQRSILKKRKEFDQFLQDNFNNIENAEDYV